MNRGAVTIITHFINDNNSHEVDLREFLNKQTYNDTFAIPTLLKHIELYKKADSIQTGTTIPMAIIQTTVR